jgi:hypothetical protein
MELIPQIAWVVFCLFFAYVNYRLIEKVQERVRHGINGIFGAVTCAYFGLCVDWRLGLVMLFEGRLFFDSLLNFLRFKRINYVSPKPASIIDQLEKKVFGLDGYTPKILYFAIIVIINLCAYAFS